MKAFLLAAGFGERLRPLTERIPKPLAPVMNVPAVCYSLTLLKRAGVTALVCNLHHLRDAIRSFFRSHENFGMDVVFSDEESILGTGGGLMKCRSFVDDGPFFYVNSDIIADIDLGSLARAHASSGGRGTLAVAPSTMGRGRVTVRHGGVVDLRSILGRGGEPRHDFLGAAVLDHSIFTHLAQGVSDIVDTALISLAGMGSLAAYEYGGPWHDIGTPETYRLANIDCAVNGMAILEEIPAATGFAPSDIAPGSVIDEGARVVRSVIGEGCRVGPGSLVKESVLLPGAVLGEGAHAVGRVLLP